MKKRTKDQSVTTIPVKAALAVGKNHKVLLIMTRATAASTVTASDATATSGLGSGLGSGSSQSKNSRSCLKLVLCWFLPNSCPHTKFHISRTEKIEVKKIC